MAKTSRVVLTLLLWIGLLHQVRTMTTVNIDKRGTVFTTNLVNLQTTVKLNVDRTLLASSQANMYLIFYGDSHTVYTIKAGEKGNLNLVCSGADWTICLLDLNDERPNFNAIGGYLVEITLESKEGGSLGFGVDDHIMGNIAIPYTIIGRNMETVKLRLFGTNDASYEKLRYEFVALTTTHHADRTSISAEGNFGLNKGWPTPEQHDFSLKHLHGTEIATVFDDKDPHFCVAKIKCEYRFLLRTQNVHTIYINSNFARRIEEITDNMNFVDPYLTIVRSPDTER